MHLMFMFIFGSTIDTTAIEIILFHLFFHFLILFFIMTISITTWSTIRFFFSLSDSFAIGRFISSFFILI